MKLIIDSRMRNIEKKYLSQFGEIIEISPQNTVYQEICGHPDIFFCKLDTTIFKAPNLVYEGLECINGREDVGAEYPYDVKYNLCQIGNNVIHNFNYTDKAILEYIENNNFNKIFVKQGYSRCSICVVSDTACITSDIGIYKATLLKNIDCLYLDENVCKLSDKNGIETNMRGFIGGATCIIDNKFILFGDSDLLENKLKLLEFLNKYALELVDFKGLNIHDYGGVIVIN